MEALEPEKTSTSAWQSHSALKHQAPQASVLIGRGKGRQSPDVEGCSDDEISDERREWFAHREQKSKEFGVGIGVDLEDETVQCDVQDGNDGTEEDRKIGRPTETPIFLNLSSLPVPCSDVLSALLYKISYWSIISDF